MSTQANTPSPNVAPPDAKPAAKKRHTPIERFPVRFHCAITIAMAHSLPRLTGVNSLLSESDIGRLALHSYLMANDPLYVRAMSNGGDETMPALRNPRHEAFAQAIFSGIIGAKGGAHSQAEAYRRAGYHVTNGNSARACASRLLMFANGIGERIKELQAIAAEHAVESADKCVQELNELRREARADKAYAAAVSAVMGKAKILGIADKPQTDTIDFSTSNSMQDIGKKLLQSVGYAAPSDADVALAIQANDVFIAKLERIRDSAQGVIIDQ